MCLVLAYNSAIAAGSDVSYLKESRPSQHGGNSFIDHALHQHGIADTNKLRARPAVSKFLGDASASQALRLEWR